MCHKDFQAGIDWVLNGWPLSIISGWFIYDSPEKEDYAFQIGLWHTESVIEADFVT